MGQVALQTSEIAEDLTYYFATSEQVPSAVGLGVLMNKDNTVRQAGGFIVQLMPFAEEEVIASLRKTYQRSILLPAFWRRAIHRKAFLRKYWKVLISRSMIHCPHSSTATAAENVWKKR